MKVKLLALVAVFFSYIVFVPSIASKGTFAEKVQSSIQESVAVFSVCGGNAYYGGGTIVGSNGEIITVSHIVPTPDCHVVVKTAGSTEVIGAKILKIDTGLDLALVSIDRTTPRVVRLADRKLEAGETIFTVGAPGHLQGTVTKGIVSNTEVETGANPGAIIYDVTVLPGSSGGGVFDEQGGLAGIIKATIATPGSSNTLAVGIRRKAIQDFLKENLPDEKYSSQVFQMR